MDSAGSAPALCWRTAREHGRRCCLLRQRAVVALLWSSLACGGILLRAGRCLGARLVRGLTAGQKKRGTWQCRQATP